MEFEYTMHISPPGFNTFHDIRVEGFTQWVNEMELPCIEEAVYILNDKERDITRLVNKNDILRENLELQVSDRLKADHKDAEEFYAINY